MILKNKKFQIIGIYATVHAVVDFCCAAILFSLAGKTDIISLLQLVILYNILAFGLQFIFGYIADKIKHPDNFAITGCLFLIAGICIYKNPMLTVILIAIGNALFHTGGGIISLEMGNGRAKLPGIFVAPGAIGLFLGAFWWTVPNVENIYLAFLPLISIGLMLFIPPPEEKQKIYETEATVPVYTLIILLILISVCIRSFVGLSYDFAAKNDFQMMILLIAAISAGKALGGILADKFGMFNTAVIGLLLSVPLLKYGFIAPLAILGMFFFNFTMPITLTSLANMMPKYKGLAFGLTTLALLIGSLPILNGYKVSQSMLFFEIIIISVIISAISLKLYEKLFHRP